MNRKLWEIILLVIVGVMVVSCASTDVSVPEATTEIETQEGKAIVETVCTGCHSLNKVTSASYDRAGWEKTVERMIAKGAELDSAQKETLIDYLVTTYSK